MPQAWGRPSSGTCWFIVLIAYNPTCSWFPFRLIPISIMLRQRTHFRSNGTRDVEAARQSDGDTPSVTSHKANGNTTGPTAVTAMNGTKLCDRVAAELRTAGRDGLTDEELVDRFCRRGEWHKAGVIRARRCELTKTGRVVDSGRVRRSRDGSDAIVWIAAEIPAARANGSATPLFPAASPNEVLHPAATPCVGCGSTWWRYPTKSSPRPQRVVCHGCGKFIGYTRAEEPHES